MEIAVGDEVEITGKVMTKDNQVMDFNETRGTVKKVENDHYYVETEYGVHYLPIDRIQKVT